jgi:hypothetical protein
LRETGLEPAGVCAGQGKDSFLGLPVLPVAAMAAGAPDRVIVASFARLPEGELAELRRPVADEKLIFLDRASL